MPQPTPFVRPERLDVTIKNELAAMEAIAAALAQLDNDETRTRVIHWAMSRFTHAAPAVTAAAPIPASSPTPAPSVAARAASDDGLSVSTLDDLFAAREKSTGGMIHEFVTEFQGIVHEWNAACSTEPQKR